MKTKTVKVFLTFLITIILAAAFIACDPVGGGGSSGGSGDTGGSGGTGGGGGGGGTGGGTGGSGGGSGGSGTKVTLNIHLPSSGSRAAWLHDSDPSVLDRLEYNITLSGNGETISLTKKGGGTVQVTVSVGYWNLSVNAFYNGSLYALGSTSVNVIAGANDVSLLLEKPPETPVTPPTPPVPTYTVSGTITNSSGVAISGASVQLKIGGTNSGSSVTTDASGEYTITGVADGSYTIEVSATGYAGTDTVTVSSANVTKNMALAPITYTVVFNAGYIQGGTTAIEGVAGTTATQTFSYGETKALTANGFSREGFTFAGWSTAANGTAATTYTNSQPVSNLATTNGATVTLYARWNFSYNIGDTGPGTGIIFYRNPDAQTMSNYGTFYYLEAATSNLPGTYTWCSCASTGCLSGAGVGTATGLGQGWNNTALIIAAHSGDTSSNNAAIACDGYTSGGKTDWFLPSRDELVALYNYWNLTKPASLNVHPTDAPFLSSSQFNANSAYFFNFSQDTTPGWLGKSWYAFMVRPIRAF